MHYTSQETIDLIVSLRKEGKNYTQIREATGCSKGTISKYCTQYGVSKDPTQKDFGISGTTKSFEKLKPELDKCVLLCANCHGEVHEGLLDINKFI